MNLKNNYFAGKRKFTVQVSILLILIFGLLILELRTGSADISLREILTWIFHNDRLSGDKAMILSQFRIPRVITALLVGAGLSASGLQMQSIFRNPLAGPYVLGISAGASLGAAIVVLRSQSAFSGLFYSLGITAAAWIGAALVMLLLLLVSIRIRNIMIILILGIMFSSALSAVISIMQYFGNAEALKSFVIWSMGSLGDVTRGDLLILAVAITIGLLINLFAVKGLNALAIGEEYASSMGTRVLRIRILVFISTSILAGSVTAFCGPIGFIGIAVPHIARFITGRSDLRYLMPATLLTGMLVMLVSDFISQVPGSDTILPINAVTSLIGIPVVIWVVIGGRRIVS
jgi:iron complex transport system permease protein